MRWTAVTATAVVVTFCGRGAALETPIPTLPPFMLDESLPLGGGTDVSRPLTPVEALPDLPTTKTTSPVKRVQDVADQTFARRGPLGPGWDDFEFLLWWPKSQGLPPLVTGSRSGTPVLGNPGTSVLIGGHSIQNQDVAGGRFTLGVSINPEETIGLEGVYFFLGSRTLKATVRDQGNSSESIGLPYVNSVTTQENVFLVGAPGVSRGSVYVSSTNRLQGAEGNFVVNLADDYAFRLNGIVGYRFLQVNEGLGISVQRTEVGGAGVYGPMYDGFDGHNQFNGGQLGLHADFSHGPIFCELTGKVALGVTSEVVQINGASTLYTPVMGGVSSQTIPGGVYSLSSNIGHFSRSEFAVVPEGTFKVGVKLCDATRLFVGYNFLYLSDLVRPGDQIDRTLNPSQIPALNAGAAFANADRPHVLFSRTDFWTQGLLIGFETRY